MPETWPRIQLPGSGFGQNGSGWKRGPVSALGGCCAGALAPAASSNVAANTIDNRNRITPSLMPFVLLAPIKHSGAGSAVLRCRFRWLGFGFAEGRAAAGFRVD